MLKLSKSSSTNYSRISLGRGERTDAASYYRNARINTDLY